MLLAITSQEIELAGIFLVSLVLSIAVHEFGHAFVAHKLGDPTPEGEGRLTLNPVSHADPIGTLLLPVVAAFTAMPLFGWGRPVPTQPRHYKRTVSMRGGMALVALAGPMFNLLLALVVLGVAAICSAAGVLGAGLALPLLTLLQLNLVLMVFNLIPLHPLDGGKILAFLMPSRWEAVDEWLTQYGGILLIVLMVAGSRFLMILFAPFYAVADWAWTFAVGLGA